MAAAKRAWCSGSNDFNVVAADSGSERPPCLPSDSRMAEAAKRRRLAEVFDELDDVSSDSCWSSTSESSSSSSDDDDEVYAAAFQQLFSLPERRPKVEAYVTKTFKRNFRVTRPVVDFLAAEFAKSPHCPQNSDHGGLPAKSAEEHILSFLWWFWLEAQKDVAALSSDELEPTELVIDERAPTPEPPNRTPQEVFSMPAGVGCRPYSRSRDPKAAHGSILSLSLRTSGPGAHMQTDEKRTQRSTKNAT
ncbi:hypothetical protein HPB51_001145 [Rhipicephalus microplus]|uniref:Uncharacterized protein n=1 Tax=Rhipicephalus microplus TaxID=6941 RepID=A0A9J6EVK8_RHIMP|nr:hypothetical protein HPB51_001145 [Rhipicephalus microplus]